MNTRAKREAAVKDLRRFDGVVDAPREGDDDPVEAAQVLDRGLALCVRVHAGNRWCA